MKIPEDINFYMIFFYNKGQMHFPNPTKIFGSDFLLMDLPNTALTQRPGNETGLGKYQYFKQDFYLTQVHWKAIDHKKQRCDNKRSFVDEENSVSECIVGYLEEEIGCSMQLYGSKKEIRRSVIYHQFSSFYENELDFWVRCNETGQLKKYLDFTAKLYLADENEVFELTGCLSTCEKYEYAVQPMTDLTVTEENDHNKANTVRLQFYFTTGRHELREQVKYLIMLQTKPSVTCLMSHDFSI